MFKTELAQAKNQCMNFGVGVRGAHIHPLHGSANHSMIGLQLVKINK